MTTATKTMCGAPGTRGYPCKRLAGQGTAHPGSGFCLYHDNTGVIRIKGKGGGIHRFNLTGWQFKRRVHDLANDSDILNLNNEIAFARVLIERINKGDEDVGSFPKTMMYNMILSTIGRLVERKHRIEMERKGLIKIQFVISLMDAWSKSLNELIADADMRQRLGTRVSALVTASLPAASVRELSEQFTDSREPAD